MKRSAAKSISILLSIVMCILLSIQPAFAQTDTQTVYYNVISFEDGSYIVDEIHVSNPDPSGIGIMAATKSKTATRTYTGYNKSNTKCWSFTLKGTFQYDGSTSKATAASSSYTTYVSGWKCSSKTATYSGNTAKGTATFKHLTTSANVAIGLKCSADGTISNVNY